MEDTLRAELAEMFTPWIDSVDRHGNAVRNLLDAMNEVISAQSRDIAALRDELHDSHTALSNRIEALTRGAA